MSAFWSLVFAGAPATPYSLTITIIHNINNGLPLRISIYLSLNASYYRATETIDLMIILATGMARMAVVTDRAEATEEALEEVMVKRAVVLEAS